MTEVTGKPTAEEARLAEELVCLVDYVGRVLFTALDGRGPHYLWEKSRELARVADRVAGILGDGGWRGSTVRLPVVARTVVEGAQYHTAGRALFGPRGGGA